MVVCGFCSCVVLVSDLWSYWFHRLQHAVPFLWAMHSFHHSARNLTFITGSRHLWIERVLTGAFLPVMAILFVVPPSLPFAVLLIGLIPNNFAHLNLRISFGRATTWINNPQWHRIHHSLRPEHHDKNFAAVLTLWDFIFGTACVPKEGEYPPTGIASDEHVSFIDSIIWPFRHLRRKRSQDSLVVGVNN
jgi:sterol desaturase/sphingolipid hydroxylase (fatty acid hydroxylase superfamily)